MARSMLSSLPAEAAHMTGVAESTAGARLELRPMPTRYNRRMGRGKQACPHALMQRLEGARGRCPALRQASGRGLAAHRSAQGSLGDSRARPGGGSLHTGWVGGVTSQQQRTQGRSRKQDSRKGGAHKQQGWVRGACRVQEGPRHEEAQSRQPCAARTKGGASWGNVISGAQVVVAAHVGGGASIVQRRGAAAARRNSHETSHTGYCQ
jgi:hypothetical protein